MYNTTVLADETIYPTSISGTFVPPLGLGVGALGFKMQTKGKCNHYIETAIKNGLHYKDGDLINGKGRVLKASTSSAGYKVISLGLSGSRRSFNVARIVCWLFHGKPPTLQHQADHINRDRTDDSPSNLRWATPSENGLNISEEDRANRKVLLLKVRSTLKGEAAPWAKLTQKQVMEIKDSDLSQSALGRKYGVSQQHISRLKKGMQWKHLPTTPEESKS